MVVVIIKIICIVKLFGILNKKCKFLFICNVLKFNVVVMFVIVVMIVNILMVLFKGLCIVFLFNKGVNVVLIKLGYFLWKLKYVNISVIIL